MEEVKKLSRPTLEVLEKLENCMAVLNKSGVGDEYWKASEELNTLEQEWDWYNYTFTDPATGKVGVKDVTGKVLVPAEYDEIGFEGNYFYYHETPKAVKKDGKWGLVTGNGTNQVLTGFKYDRLTTYPYTSLFCFHADGKSDTFGILYADGTELVPNILTSCSEVCNGIISFESNGKYGVLDLDTNDVLMPQYDNLECEDLDGLITFVKDGVKGYVNTHNEFVTIEDYDAGNFDVEETFFAMSV